MKSEKAMHLRGHEEHDAGAVPADVGDEPLGREARSNHGARPGGTRGAQEDAGRGMGQGTHNQVRVGGAEAVARAQLVGARALLPGGAPAALGEPGGAGGIEERRAGSRVVQRQRRAQRAIEVDDGHAARSGAAVRLVHEQRPRPRVCDDPRSLGRSEARVDGYEHEIGRGRGIARGNELRTIAREHRDPIARVDAECGNPRDHGCGPARRAVLVEDPGHPTSGSRTRAPRPGSRSTTCTRWPRGTCIRSGRRPRCRWWIPSCCTCWRDRREHSIPEIPSR